MAHLRLAHRKIKCLIVDIIVVLSVYLLFMYIFIPLIMMLFSCILLLLIPNWIPYSFSIVADTIVEAMSHSFLGFMLAMTLYLIFKSVRKIALLSTLILLTITSFFTLHNTALQILFEGEIKTNRFLLWIGIIVPTFFLWFGAYLGILFVHRTINMKQNHEPI